MEGLLADIVAWMTAIPPLWAYVALFTVAYGENVVPPIPGDMVIVFAGYLVAVGRLDYWVVVMLSTVGGAAGFMTLYAVGYRIGEAVLDPHRLRWLPKKQIVRAERWVRRWGYGVVLANRFLSGLRSVISLTVGVARMDVWQTGAFSTLSALVWTGLITYLGYAVGENWPIISVYLRRYGFVVIGLVVLFVVVRLVRRHRRLKRDGDDGFTLD